MNVTEHMAECDASCRTQGEASFSCEWLLPGGMYPRETSPSTGKKVLTSRSITPKSPSPAEDRPQPEEPGLGSESTLTPLLPHSFLQNTCHSCGLNGRCLQSALHASRVLGILASGRAYLLVFSVHAVDVYGTLADSLQSVSGETASVCSQ